MKVSFLTGWSSSCQWSTVPPVRPWACCQSLHPPEPESGTHGTCSSPPEAGVWFCKASSVHRWQSERLLAPSSSCRRFQASWTLFLVAYCSDNKGSNGCNWSERLILLSIDRLLFKLKEIVFRNYIKNNIYCLSVSYILLEMLSKKIKYANNSKVSKKWNIF